MCGGGGGGGEASNSSKVISFHLKNLKSISLTSNGI